MRKKDGERAFSLLEVVVTLGVLTLLLLPLARTLNDGMAGVIRAKVTSEATALLQRAVEEIKQTDFDAVKSTQPVKYPTSDSAYYLQISAVDQPERESVDGAGIKTVTLTIFTDDGGSTGEKVAEIQFWLYRYDGL